MHRWITLGLVVCTRDAGLRAQPTGKSTIFGRAEVVSQEIFGARSFHVFLRWRPLGSGAHSHR